MPCGPASGRAGWPWVEAWTRYLEMDAATLGYHDRAAWVVSAESWPLLAKSLAVAAGKVDVKPRLLEPFYALRGEAGHYTAVRPSIPRYRASAHSPAWIAVTSEPGRIRSTRNRVRCAAPRLAPPWCLETVSLSSPLGMRRGHPPKSACTLFNAEISSG